MSILDLWCAEGVGDPNVYYDLASATSISATGGRRGNPAFSLTSGASTAIKRIINPAQATLYFGACFKMTVTATGANKGITFMDGTSDQIYVEFVSDNGVTAYLKVKRGDGTLLGTGTRQLLNGNWYYIEFKATIHDSTGAFEVRIDEQTDITASNVDTKNTTNASVGVVGIYRNHNLYNLMMDGYITTDAFLGDIRNDVAFPTADGSHTDFTPSTGVNHYALIDEATPSISDYVASSTLNHIDTYDVTLASIGTAIKAVQLQVYADKSDGGARGLSPVIVSGTTTDVGTEWVLNEADDYYSAIYETDPDDSATWTEAKIAAAEFGFKVTT